ncbi:hypothetical protein SODALDRAFT_275518 [Sodiomyces alkalinus F11]|uniref:DUF1996 domain-containing protein n=1 Tax=Sodiomyces alkalinus (strain CBS 110278 / VKM F-3762 / F11) TaxID=1314773 RepID=A0A3N2PWR0_SODAK|nr:hypothetical protein SODALDRAFT_275518 [Sodiomyces alkalinus F11]ROT38938.1 hypothetical protein SODALDRAFT_275518 [Sodiomyces alkalinus F11]
MNLLQFALLVAPLALKAEAFFRMECQGRVALGRIDPIVSPGEPALHVHSIHGSSGISMHATYDDLRNGQCTSCRVTQDKSAYWHPSMYFQDGETGEFELVEQVGGMLAYYQFHLDNLTAFPAGFRMIAGNSNRRNWSTWDLTQPDPPADQWYSKGLTTQESLGERSMGFNCLNYAGNPEPTLYRHTIPDKAFIDANCPNGIRTEITFPSCWNGKDLGSEDHRSHMAYPDMLRAGQCPDDFPVHMPTMLFETVWNVKAFNGRNGRFVMANGDSLGWGYHGDFMTGWDEDFLQQALDTCTANSGNILDCPIFDIISEEEARECTMEVPSILSTEDVEGPLRSLPGNVPIIYEDGTKEYGGDAPVEDSPVPSLAPNPITSEIAIVLPEPVPTSEALPEIQPDFNAAVDLVSSEAFPEPEFPETTWAPEPPAEPTKSFYSTQVVTEGDKVSVIYWDEEVVYVTEYYDSTTTVTVAPSAHADSVAKRHLHGHIHHRRHHG